MRNTTEKKSEGQEKSSSQTHQWWYIQSLIAALDAETTVKYFLTLVHLHTNFRKGFAWTEQKKLAVEMGCSLSTVERAVRWTKKLGIVQFRRIRTGKGKADQYNEYWLDVERLKILGEHPSPTKGAQDVADHRATVKSTPEHPSNPLRAPVTHDGIGSELKQCNKVMQYNNSPHLENGAGEITKQAIQIFQRPTPKPTPKPEPQFVDLGAPDPATQNFKSFVDSFAFKPEPKTKTLTVPNDSNDPFISSKQAHKFWDQAFALHWKRPVVLSMLRKCFGISRAADLRASQFEQALSTLRSAIYGQWTN